MKLSQASPRLRFHPDAYRFVFEALQYTQEKLRLPATEESDDESHITGRQLLGGIRQLALKKFGLMSRTVFHYWGIHSTECFGHIVFELVERGEMRKTDRDHISDFYDVFEFDDALDGDYAIPTEAAFG